MDEATQNRHLSRVIAESDITVASERVGLAAYKVAHAAAGMKQPSLPQSFRVAVSAFVEARRLLAQAERHLLTFDLDDLK